MSLANRRRHVITLSSLRKMTQQLYEVSDVRPDMNVRVCPPVFPSFLQYITCDFQDDFDCHTPLSDPSIIIDKSHSSHGIDIPKENVFYLSSFSVKPAVPNVKICALNN